MLLYRRGKTDPCFENDRTARWRAAEARAALTSILQTTTIRHTSFVERILKFCARDRDPNDLLFSIKSYQEVYVAVRDFCMYFALHLHLTPHSLRAGGATKNRIDGLSIVDIQENGRWEHQKTAKRYIDVVFTRMDTCLAEEQKVPALEHANFYQILSAPW